MLGMAASRFMADAVDGFPPILDYTPATLLGLGIALILLGYLVPARSVKSKDDEIAYLRSALSTEQAAHQETLKQNSDLLETNRLVRSFFAALKGAVE